MTSLNRAKFYHVQIESKIYEAPQIPIYNLTEELLESQILSPYNKGEVTTIRGVSLKPSDIVRVLIFVTSRKVPSVHPDKRVLDNLKGMKVTDSTDVFIKGPPGWESGADVHNIQEVRPNADVSEVFVVHGRNMSARNALFEYLRAIGLRPLEWAEAVRATGKPSPYIGEILDAAFSRAHAVVVLFTPDDEARLKPEFRTESDPPYETELTGQARPNVLFEAGMALGRYPNRTVFVEVGSLRKFTDVDGIHAIRMDGSSQRRQDLAQRLQTAGCPVNLNGTDWHTAGDFEAALASFTYGAGELQGSIQQRETDAKHLQLSKQAKELLIEANEDDYGAIDIFETLGGKSIQTNHKQFVEIGNPRSEAIWEGAINDLLNAGFLAEEITLNGSHFKLTREGYEAIDSLKSP